MLIIGNVSMHIADTSIASDGLQPLPNTIKTNGIPEPQSVLDSYHFTTPILFTPNLGQLSDSRIKFYVRGGGLWFAKDGLWLLLKHGGGDGIPVAAPPVKQAFVNANSVEPRGMVKAELLYNFYYGNNPLSWRAGVQNFFEIYYSELYKGIDLRYYSKDDELKYDFIIKPGGDPSQIRLRYDGASGIELDREGNLVVHTYSGDIIDGNLCIFQDLPEGRSTVHGSFKIHDDNEYGFEIDSDYDRGEILVIDPFLEYSTFLGGQYRDRGEGIAVDGLNCAYVTGYTNSDEFPTTVYAYDVYFNGNNDVFVTKFNNNGSGLAYSTFIGSNNDDRATDIAVNSAEEVFITGYTASSTFPSTSPLVHRGLTEALAVRLDDKGKLLYSALLGGSKDDFGRSIAIDSAGYAFIAGDSDSSDFPTTSGALNQSHNGNSDIIVFKLNPSGNAAVFATYVGGTYDEGGNAIAVDQYGYSYVTGFTESADFFSTTGAYDENNNGNRDAVVFKLNDAGSAVHYSTFIGGLNNDEGYDIAVDPKLEVYVTGGTVSTDFPSTNIFGNDSGKQNGFILKLDTFGQTLRFSNIIGGENDDICYAVAIDQFGNIYVTGTTDTAVLYITEKSIYRTPKGGRDVFVGKFDAVGNKLSFFTYVGGVRNDEGAALVLDTSLNIYVTGFTSSSDFPATAGSFDPSTNYNDDAFLFKISFTEKFEIESLTILKDSKETSKIYARHGVYTFMVIITDTFAIDDIDSTVMLLDPGGESLSFDWDRMSNDFGDSHAEVRIEPTSYAYSDNFTRWYLHFDLLFEWEYPDEDTHDIKITVYTENFGKQDYIFKNIYSVEKDIQFSGNLVVLGEDDRVINENGYVRGGEKLWWTNLSVVFEGTTDLEPQTGAVEITITDDAGSKWNSEYIQGKQIYMTSTAPFLSDYIGFVFKINITEKPSGTVKATREFSVKVDFSDVEFYNPEPYSGVEGNVVEVGITLRDSQNMVDASTIQYSYSYNGGETWSAWETVWGYDDAEDIHVRISMTFNDGDDNRIKWRASDTLGNGPAVSEAYTVKVNVDIIPDFGVHLTLSEKSLILEPGSSYSIIATVQNTGKQRDSIIINRFFSYSSQLNITIIGNNTLSLNSSDIAAVKIKIDTFAQSRGEFEVNITATSTGSFAYGLTVGEYRILTVIINASDDIEPPGGDGSHGDSTFEVAGIELMIVLLIVVILMVIIIMAGYLVYLKRSKASIKKGSEPALDKVAVFSRPKQEELNDFIESGEEKKKENDSRESRIIDMAQGEDGRFVERRRR